MMTRRSTLAHGALYITGLSAPLTGNVWNNRGKLLDPGTYVRAADIALASGDRDRARFLTAQAYRAFDACAALQNMK